MQRHREIGHLPAGFTLLEMSIVLVIVGLVTASGMQMGTTILQSTQLKALNAASHTALPSPVGRQEGAIADTVIALLGQSRLVFDVAKGGRWRTHFCFDVEV
jgi:prepilin-type N-terminal cleavage/methylation domain-containing protein